ncbi:MAG: class I SAM-dependent methyltransferase [Candidatus Competibacter sp.]
MKLADQLRLVPGQQVLDVACGVGGWLEIAASRGATISGIDISERAIDICRQRLPEGEFQVGPAETLPFPDRRFDLITCLGSLEHFLDQPSALREMVRVAKPDARLLILVPNAGFLTYRLRLYSGTHQQAVRETIRTLEEWQQLFGEAGLEIINRWKDLHVLSRSWIVRPPWYWIPLRFIQALALAVWPLEWQYQVYHQCRIRMEG